MSGPNVGQDLAEAVVPGTLLSGDAAARHDVDGVRPRFVAAPATVAGVSRVLALASAHGLAVVPVAGGARAGWGAPPRRLDIVLSLARLDRILAHEPADLMLSVECGATIASLDAALRPHRQFVPLDPPWPHASTVGGLIATGAAGPYRARYGTMRDLLVGLTVVRADGTLVKGGGRVVKNVTGYDIPKLHVGALGTLGVVVEAHLRLHPRPAEERSWMFGFHGPEAALDAALEVRDTPLVLSRCHLLAGDLLVAMGASSSPEAALAVTLGGVPRAVAAQQARVAEICARTARSATEVPAPDAWWRRVAEATSPEAGTSSLTLRIGIRPTDVVKAIRAVEAVRPTGASVGAAADLATGVLHVRLAPVEAPGVADLVGGVRDGLGPLRGSCVVEHAPPLAKPGLDVWGDVGPALEPMRRLKRELDPAGVLNPGRFVGGI